MTGATIAILFGCCLLFFAWQRLRLMRMGRQNNGYRHLRPRTPALEHKLLKLLGGKRNIAHRLINQSRLKYPDKSADWHWEKAIYDLERDRWR